MTVLPVDKQQARQMLSLCLTNQRYGSQVLDDKERVEKILGAEFVTIYPQRSVSQIPYNSYLMSETRLAQVCADFPKSNSACTWT